MMRRLLWLLAGVLLLSLAPAARANENAQGWCEVGAQPVVTSGLNSTNTVQQSFPQCTVTVFVHGGGLATIYSDNNGTPTPLANPFTATTDGQWLFYAGDGRYDVQLSGTGFPFPVTYSDILLCDPANHGACGGGGGGGVSGSGTPNIITKWATTTSLTNSSGFDDGVNVVQWPNGLSIMARPLTELWPNASGGTIASTLVEIVAGQAVSTTNATDPNQVYGIAFQDAGTSGNVQVATLGQTPCIFDGQTTQGDQVTMSTTVAPDCHDTGSPDLTVGVPSFGKVVSNNTGTGTIGTVDLQLPGLQAFAGGGGTIVQNLCPYGVTTISASYTVQPSDACHMITVTGSASGQTLTLPQPGTSGTTSFVGETIATPSGGTSISVTRNLTAGNMAFMVGNSQSAGGSSWTGCTDSADDTFTNIGGNMTATVIGNVYSLQTAYALNVTGGSTTITCNVATTASGLTLAVYEYANVLGLDQTAQQNVGPTVGGTAIISPPVTTTTAVQLLIGTSQNSCSPVGSGPGPGYVARSFNNSNFLINGAEEDQIVGVIGGPYAAGIVSNCSSSLVFSAQIATFRISGLAGNYLNGFWIWPQNGASEDWTVAATSSNIVACDGTSAGSTTLAAIAGLTIESDGFNWQVGNCGIGGGGGGSGTVTSIAVTAPIAASPSPITSTGTISCPTCFSGTLTTGLIPVASGAHTLVSTPGFTADSTTGAIGITSSSGVDPLTIVGTAPPDASIFVTTNNGGSAAGIFSVYTSVDASGLGGNIVATSTNSDSTGTGDVGLDAFTAQSSMSGTNVTGDQAYGITSFVNDTSTGGNAEELSAASYQVGPLTTRTQLATGVHVTSFVGTDAPVLGAGVLVDDQGGLANVFAIKTGTGPVSFGDTLSVTGTITDSALTASRCVGTNGSKVLTSAGVACPSAFSGSTTVAASTTGALNNGDCVSIDASGNFVDSGTAGPCGAGSGGAVTSVGLALPAALFTITGSPVTVSGTLTGSFITNATANDVFGNCTGSAATPSFCAITAAMLSGVSYAFNKVSSGTNTTAAMLVGTGASLGPTGSGTITATAVPFSGVTAASFTGGALTIGTGGSLAPTGSGSLTANVFTPAGTTNNCVKWGVGGALADAGAVCGAGGGSTVTVNGGSALPSPVNFQNGAATNGITITASNPSLGNVQFAATGTRTIAGGGTSATTAIAAFNNLSPLTTTGDVLSYTGGANVRVPSAAGCFQATGVGTLPFYGACTAGSLTGSAAVGSIPKMATTTSITTSSISDNGTTVSTSEPVSTPTVTYTGTGPLIVTGTEGSCAGATSAKDVLCLGDATTHTAQVSVNGGSFVQLARVLTGSTGSLGGSAIANGTCSTTVATITGAALGQAVIVTPTTVPGAGFFWDGYVSTTNTITVRVCNATGSTNSPTASGYNIRVIL